MTINEFWEIVDRTPDLVFKRNLQIPLMGNFGLQYGAPWLRKSGSSTFLLCKDGNVENVFHFLFACPKLEDEWAIFWYILKEKVSNSDYLEKNILLHFIDNLDKPTAARLLLGGLSLPFNGRNADFVNKFVAVSIRKIYKIRQTHDQRSAFILMESYRCNFNILLYFFPVLLYPFYVNEMF